LSISVDNRPAVEILGRHILLITIAAYYINEAI
jgi:hypothetical protein